MTDQIDVLCKVEVKESNKFDDSRFDPKFFPGKTGPPNKFAAQSEKSSR